MRFLFVVPPLAGHVNPTVSVARVLESAGHTVAWAAHRDAVAPLLPHGAEILPLNADLAPEAFDRMRARWSEVRGLEGLKFLWEDFLLPLARMTRQSIEEAVDLARPSVMVVDQQVLAGALVARRRGLPWATFATTSADPVESVASLPKVQEWVRSQLSSLQAEAGVSSGSERFDISPFLVVVFSTPALAGPERASLPQYQFVGPSITDRPDSTPFPWESLQDGPVVLVSLGTVNAMRGERFYSTVIEALGHSHVQVVLVAPEELVGVVPDNVIVRRRVPQLRLLPRVHAVVCHGGHNTVCEALAHGLPLVVAPIKDDQPVIAQQVVDAGAGIRVRFGRVSAAELRTAVERVLHEDSFKGAAAAIQASFAAAGGAARAARLLEGLV